MAALVPTDKTGVFGPSITILSMAEAVNEEQIHELTELLKANFLNLTDLKLKGKKAFCAYIEESRGTITQVSLVGQSFFQNMQKEGMKEAHYKKALNYIVPQTRKCFEAVKEFNVEKDAAIDDWMAKVLGSTMSEEQIEAHWVAKTPEDEAMQAERTKVSIALSSNVQITEKDLDAIIAQIKNPEAEVLVCDHRDVALEFSQRYLNVLAMPGDSAGLKANLLNLLNTIFRKKISAAAAAQALATPAADA